MINTLKIKASQVQLCKDIVAYYNAKTGEGITEEMKARYAKGLFRRIELQEAHLKLRQHVANPYFITKNLMAKASVKEGASLYNVQKFIDHAAKHPPVEVVKPEKPVKAPKTAKPEKPVKATPAPKGKKEDTAKKEAAPKKEKTPTKAKKTKTPVEPVAEMNEAAAIGAEPLPTE